MTNTFTSSLRMFEISNYYRIMEQMGRFEEGVRVICLISVNNREAKIESFKLDCECSFRLSPSKSFHDITWILDEMYDTQRQTTSHRFRLFKQLSILIQLTFKKPSLIVSLFFLRTTFSCIAKTNCLFHEISAQCSNKIWYSRSAATVGFPWSREVFTNALDMIRNRDIEVFVFAMNPNISKMGEENPKIVTTKINSGIYLELESSAGDSQNSKEIGVWHSTHFYRYSRAEIFHGLFIMQDGLFVGNTSTDIVKLSNPSHVPSGLWRGTNSSNFNSVLTMPAFEEHSVQKDILFIEGNLNIYHFLSESIRPLVFALESGIPFEGIAVRDDLPERFFEILKWLAPGIAIIRIKRGQRLWASTVIAATISKKLSSSSDMFTSDTSSFEEDEWRSFNYLRGKQIFSEGASEIIYIPRERNQSRGIINNSKIKEKLLSMGAISISPDSMNFETQLTHFSRARIFISTGGASLTNALFLPKNSTLIELTYPWGHNWKLISVFCDLEYRGFPVQSVLPSRFRTVADTYRVNIKGLENLVRSIQSVNKTE